MNYQNAVHCASEPIAFLPNNQWLIYKVKSASYSDIVKISFMNIHHSGPEESILGDLYQ